MALFQRPHRYTHLITTAMPGRVTSTKHLPLNLQPASPEIYDKLAQAASESGSEATPVHVFPEGGLTNGSGMLQVGFAVLRCLLGAAWVRGKGNKQSKASLPVWPRTAPNNSHWLALIIDPIFSRSSHEAS